MRWLRRVVIFLSILALLSGCSTSQSEQARKVKESGFLGDYSILHAGGKGEALLVYENPDADWPTYNKILLDPVAYYGGRDTFPEGITRADLQELVNRFYYIIHKNLSEDYQMVKNPGPGTLRIQAALTRVGKSSAALDTVSNVAPHLLNPLRSAAGSISGESPFVGEASVEVKITDSNSGQLLYAAVDRRIGGRSAGGGATRRWRDVEKILWYWGEVSRYRLCILRGGVDCAWPEE